MVRITKVDTSKKKKSSVVVPTPVARKKPVKYQLLHVPSGKLLCLGSNNYTRGESRGVFGYNKKWRTLLSLFKDFESIDLCRIEPICSADVYPSIPLCIPGSDTVISHYSFSELNRIDRLDFHRSQVPLLDDTYYNFHNKKVLEIFKRNPFTAFNCIISSSIPGFDDETREEVGNFYYIEFRNPIPESWDDYFERLFKYMQETNYAVSLKQFSSDGETMERILLMEFELHKTADVKSK